MISAAETQSRQQFFEENARKNNMRITPQKQAIYMHLAMREDHPTAQEIFSALQSTFPNMSFATVYKNLSLLAEHTIIQELNFGEGASRYDAHIEDHHHVYDTKTKMVTDVEITDEKQNFPKNIKGKPVQKVQVTYFV